MIDSVVDMSTLAEPSACSFFLVGEAVRLPTDVHVDSTAFSLLRASHTAIQCGRLQGDPSPLTA